MILHKSTFVSFLLNSMTYIPYHRQKLHFNNQLPCKVLLVSYRAANEVNFLQEEKTILINQAIQFKCTNGSFLTSACFKTPFATLRSNHKSFPTTRGWPAGISKTFPLIQSYSDCPRIAVNNLAIPTPHNVIPTSHGNRKSRECLMS